MHITRSAAVAAMIPAFVLLPMVSSPGVAAQDATPTMSYSCETAMPAPSPSPERRRNLRRSIVGMARDKPRAKPSTRVRDDDVAPSPVDLRFKSMVPPGVRPDKGGSS